MIDKDTKIYCSFSQNPGNNGCNFFNSEFEKRKINAIYKSFYSDNISESIKAVKHLDIIGFALSMPFKIDALSCMSSQDWCDESVCHIGATNTITNTKGILKAYNTDWIGVKIYFETLDLNHIFIIGDGGFSKAVQYTCKMMNICFDLINRKNWYKLNEIKNSTLFNATPVNVEVDSSNLLIDGRPHTTEGKIIALNQAKEQFKIYVGIDYE